MELMLAALALLFVALLVMHDAEPRGHRRAHHRTQPEHARAGDIVPIVSPPEDDDVLVIEASPLTPVVGVPILRPDPDRFFQHELLEAVNARRTSATVRLLVVVVVCGISAGVFVLLIGRALGVLIQRVSGA